MSNAIPSTELLHRQPGAGCSLTRHCWGCNDYKSTLGSAGTGHRWRCAACVKPQVRAHGDATRSGVASMTHRSLERVAGNGAEKDHAL